MSAGESAAQAAEPLASLAGRIKLGGEVSANRLGFGAMRLPGVWEEPRDPQQARRLLRRAIELGVNFIDTAHAYGPETSERLIAEALHPYPRELIVATKGGYGPRGSRGWAPDGRPETIRRHCQRSLSAPAPWLEPASSRRWRVPTAQPPPRWPSPGSCSGRR
jgi:pyridoxine 4-dehydrogenase